MIDVSAFEGWYSVLLAPKLGGSTMVSCEPDPSAYAELQTTLALLGRVFSEPTFIPLPVPVGDGSPVSVSQPEGAHPRFGGTMDGGRPPHVDGLVDTLGLEPGMIKIDVEGAEPFVLRGMQRDAARPPPAGHAGASPTVASGGDAGRRRWRRCCPLTGNPRRGSPPRSVATRSLWTP